MAESKDSFQEKTEEPTSKRIRDSRKKGQVAKSMEINSALILLVGLLALTIFGGMMFSQIIAAERFLFSQVGQIQVTQDTLPGYLLAAMTMFIKILAPVMVPIIVVGILANVLQFGLLFTLYPIKPKFDKLNPISGIKKFASKRSLVELVKNILKIVMIGWIGYLVISGMVDEMIPLMDQTPWAIFLFVCKGVAKIGFYTVFAILLLAILDLVYQRWQHHQEMKMTKQETKDERKQTQGDPQVKAKIRQVQFKTALQRMMKNVPTADVVVTNPTEYAIALSYDEENMTAPSVVAKGKRLIAQRIRELAIENDIPIVENPPLARELYKAAEVGQEIPGKLYQAVAEILAYVYRLRTENEVIYD
ncbi:flagellar biosynthesis protein FlhB [candidate division LCP-89 bacterium B3_LCP]|uniref:Flagellar biosynthetic protein FlhB n=1 Tax=candidate division LCP-89 bacterium B3_LCP TaxID=2012998 RepID=A0A532V4X2_UNCL8|nr:MAG: flagellar biosynthesis protein FlhB [candidate division LCP-89 bacterium B3_LCP]